jgi:hypothetical protein
MKIDSNSQESLQTRESNDWDKAGKKKLVVTEEKGQGQVCVVFARIDSASAFVWVQILGWHGRRNV